MYKKRKKCASCGNFNLTEVHNFGEVPLAGNFPTKYELSDISTYQLSLMMCGECKLVQTNSVISPDVLFSDYRYKSSVGLQTHFNNYTQWFINKFGRNPYTILEIGCNDGVLLSPMKENGFDIVGVDPARNIVDNPISNNLTIHCDYFSTEFVEKNNFTSTFDFILANNSFAHIDDITNVVNGVYNSLKDGGYFIIEVHYLLELINQFQYDNIYHEHIYYYSITSLQNLLSKFNISIVDYETINTHSGSIRIIAQKGANITQKIISAIEYEDNIGISNLDTYQTFSENIISHSTQFVDVIKKLKYEGKRIWGYGASGRANMFCNILNLTNDDIECIFDESIERYNRYIPSSNIPILDATILPKLNSENVVIVIFAWNYTNMIMDKLKEYDFQYLIPFPTVQLVDNTYRNNNTL